MRKVTNFLRGSALIEVTGAFPERFLNLCATQGIGFWSVHWQDSNTLRVKVSRGDSRHTGALAERVQCTYRVMTPAGLPAFLLRFRKRYALLLGLGLCLGAVCVLSQFILTVEVTGNVKVPTAAIVSQLGRQGVKIGAFGPAIDERQVTQGVLLELPELSFLAVNLYGTRASVVVRERDPKPEIADVRIPADVVALEGGIITHMEVTRGQPLFREGETVAPGEVLISGTVVLKGPAYVEQDLGKLEVRAGGRVVARTWRTLTAKLPLGGAVKEYTGAEETRFSATVLGRQIYFYRNSRISVPKYDKIKKTWGLQVPLVGQLPFSVTRETVRGYRSVPCALDPAAGEAMLRQALEERLHAAVGTGEVLRKDFTAAVAADGVLTVTLLAECREEISKTVERRGTP